MRAVMSCVSFVELIRILLWRGETTTVWADTTQKFATCEMHTNAFVCKVQRNSVNAAGNRVCGDKPVLTSSQRRVTHWSDDIAITLGVFMSMLTRCHLQSSEFWFLVVYFRCQMWTALISNSKGPPEHTHTHTQHRKSQTSILHLVLF